ncbi:hypothetical protein ACG0Z6_12785 [Roseateles sp. BYS180W]|uniref:Uncharacterized protein n=1 Tax=Roseateles rivi TaxID=3299028 RepID=A0ABW7FXR4_9BURK
MPQLNPKTLVGNPFAMLMNLEDVVHAMEESEPLALLNRRLCRPLDKPQIVSANASLQEEDDAEDDSAELPEQTTDASESEIGNCA